MRTTLSRHVLPDWRGVVSEYDGVHLSWAGFITAEGFVGDLGDRAAMMLRFWASERTLWLRDVFGQPEPLDAPSLTGYVSGALGIDVIGDADRAASDAQEITVRLNRPAHSAT